MLICDTNTILVQSPSGERLRSFAVKSADIPGSNLHHISSCKDCGGLLISQRSRRPEDRRVGYTCSGGPSIIHILVSFIAHLGVTRHQYRNWITGKSLRLVEKARVARLTGAAKFCDLRRRATHSIRADRNAHWRTVAEETERAEACCHSRKLYQMVRRASRGTTGASETLRSRDSAIIAGLGEPLNRWKEHFNELLNHLTSATEVAVEPTDEYDCNTAPPTVDEVRDILRRLRNNKAPGEDGIPAEIYKAVPDVFASKAILLPFFKKGDRRLCSNYRGISLIDVVAKVFAVLLLRRFQGIRDLRTRPSQGGFRLGRGCVDQIFSLRRTLEQHWAYQQPTVLCFVDFAAAFDSVDRGSLWRIMEADGMPTKLLRLIKGYYRSTRARVHAYGEEPETFEVKTGVRQGCTLSPTLFNYTIDYILGKAHQDYAGVAYFCLDLIYLSIYLSISLCSLPICLSYNTL
ncbi:unnamed protein product [Acanthosepion pharaonis]|uniref:Reverse transcriptase domain-containing protein n=1 Tax=Acanthosepion pharaonis TaxID=158019 RepID=A0A812C731_ACAPH|nr:unnamed protein product [Sepia pharaonis]